MEPLRHEIDLDRSPHGDTLRRGEKAIRGSRLDGVAETVVIIVNYDSGDRLRCCVKSVLEQDSVPCRILVIDNASQDDSASGLPDGVELLVRARNEGYGPALLDGLAASSEPFVFTLNPDTHPQP